MAPEAVSRTLVTCFNVRGRAEVIERLMLADPRHHSDLMLHESIRLGRAYLLSKRQCEAALRDQVPNTYQLALLRSSPDFIRFGNGFAPLLSAAHPTIGLLTCRSRFR